MTCRKGDFYIIKKGFVPQKVSGYIIGGKIGFCRNEHEDKLFCPYCGFEQYCHEPEDFTAYVCTTECEHCGREIEYSVEIVRTYYPTITDEDEDGEKEDE